MIEQILIQIVSTILLVGTYLIVKSYWPKYFETKAVNQATKEDIGRITEIAESIKSDLQKKTEELKAQLLLTSQHRLNLKNAEREAIFDYHNKVGAYIFYLLRFRLSGYTFDNYKNLKMEDIEFSKKQYKCDIAESHLMLFMKGQSFLEVNKNLTISVINLEGCLSKAMQSVYHLHSKAEFDIELDHKNQHAIRGAIYKDLSPILEKYRQESIELYKIVHSNLDRLNEAVTERLKQIDA